MKIDRGSAAIGTAVAVGTTVISAVVLGWIKARKKISPSIRPPGNDAKWKLVGTLANITIYPLKSGKGLELEEAECTRLGLSQVPSDDNKLLLRDRYFMLFREDNGDRVTGATAPKILQITLTSEDGRSVRIKYPGQPDLIVNIPEKGFKLARLLRSEPVNCLDCGDEAANWISKILRGDDFDRAKRIRLGYWPPSNPNRNLVGTYGDIFNDKVFKGVSNEDGGAFSDFTSYMLMISSSVDELNKRLVDLKVPAKQFRPNFYIKSDEPPFSDLTWKWVKIGNIAFKYVKGCKRCAFTTYDPDNSKKLPKNEPLTTLSRMEEAKCEEPIVESPMMGIHLGSCGSGTIRLGTPVYAIA